MVKSFLFISPDSYLILFYLFVSLPGSRGFPPSDRNTQVNCMKNSKYFKVDRVSMTEWCSASASHPSDRQ